MKYLTILNAALLALSTTMAVVMAVVWLMYRVNVDLSTRVESDLATVSAVCLAFTMMALALGGSFLGLVRRKPWGLYALAAAGIVVGLGCRYLYDVFAL